MQGYIAMFREIKKCGDAASSAGDESMSGTIDSMEVAMNAYLGFMCAKNANDEYCIPAFEKAFGEADAVTSGGRLLDEEGEIQETDCTQCRSCLDDYIQEQCDFENFRRTSECGQCGDCAEKDSAVGETCGVLGIPKCGSPEMNQVTDLGCCLGSMVAMMAQVSAASTGGSGNDEGSGNDDEEDGMDDMFSAIGECCPTCITPCSDGAMTDTVSIQSTIQLNGMTANQVKGDKELTKAIKHTIAKDLCKPTAMTSEPECKESSGKFPAEKAVIITGYTDSSSSSSRRLADGVTIGCPSAEIQKQPRRASKQRPRTWMKVASPPSSRTPT
jgi:hypothetical protein